MYGDSCENLLEISAVISILSTISSVCGEFDVLAFCRVAKMYKTPYLYRSISIKRPNN